MKRAICTVTSWSHLSQSIAMAESATRCFSNIAVHIFSIDKPKNAGNISLPVTNIFVHFIDESSIAAVSAPYFKKYGKQPDFFRWSLKPTLMRYVLKELNFQSVFFADNDLYFFENSDSLFTELEQNRFLLCPHWRIKNPAISKEWFEVNFTDGIFNAGFAGATLQGLEILDWWATACLYACEHTAARGLRADQKYLDLLPAEFEGIGITRHRGCNVAYWNHHENQRQIIDGKVLINGRWPVLFIHFTSKLEKNILNGKDTNLTPYLDEYIRACEKFKCA